MDNEAWDIDKAEEIKEIRVLLSGKSEASLLDYFSGIADVKFTIHASEMKFGETHYYRGRGKNIKMFIVPTITLYALPRKCRKPHWLYAAVFCHPKDTRFDVFTGFEVIDATRYDIGL